MKLVRKTELPQAKSEVYWDMTIPGNHNYVLGNGNVVHNTGLGFSVERQFVSQLPTVAEEFHKSDTVITVKDSKLGWATSFHELLSLLYQGLIPKWDVSKLRPAGTRLKTFGGRSSGPGPLVDLFEFCVSTFKKAAGRKLNSIECHDIMCKVGEIVVVGGVRRSALISLSNLSDDRMRAAKNGQWWEDTPHRALANNSAAYTEKPEIGIFMKEWLSLYESKSGERGIFNRVSAVKQSAATGRRETEGHEFGTNPCLHPDSMIETINGRVRIADITEGTMVYTMEDDGTLGVRPCSASWISKKSADTINLTISSGKVVRCTPDHKIFIDGRGWVEAKNVSVGDRVVHLVRNRRGAAYSGVKLTTEGKRDFVMEHHLVWEAVNGKIPDGYDIHHIDGNTYNNDIDNLECISHKDHATLTRYECDNNHQVNGGLGRFVTHPNSKGGAKTIVPMPIEIKSNLHQYATVVKVEIGETVDVYDLTVDGTHNFIADFVVVHNCGEIILRPNEFCNLSEVIIRNDDTLEKLTEKVRQATILGTFQATLVDFKYIRSIWKRNCEEERLLGVSLTGIMDHPVMAGKDGQEKLEQWLTQLRQTCIDTNKLWAEKLGIPQSAAITTVKPSGTVSQLVDSASGIHPRYSHYYVRTVRQDKKDPLGKFLKDAGVPCEDDVTKPDSTWVFSFPQAAPRDAVFRDDMSAIDQLNHYLTYKKNWCEHNPSITVYVREDEWLGVGDWVYRNFNDIGGVSFLPHTEHSYRQAPYQEIDETQYNELKAKMPKIEWGSFVEYEDNVEGAQMLACSSGVCEIT